MKLLNKFLNVIKCFFMGHVQFESAAGPTMFYQSKELGNQTRAMHMCSRCDAVFSVKGQMTEEELAAEAETEKKLAELNHQLSYLQDEIAKKSAQLKVAKSGNVELN